jgi:hypothetical protein
MKSESGCPIFVPRFEDEEGEYAEKIDCFQNVIYKARCTVA